MKQAAVNPSTLYNLRYLRSSSPDNLGLNFFKCSTKSRYSSHVWAVIPPPHVIRDVFGALHILSASRARTACQLLTRLDNLTSVNLELKAILSYAIIRKNVDRYAQTKNNNIYFKSARNNLSECNVCASCLLLAINSVQGQAKTLNSQ